MNNVVYMYTNKISGRRYVGITNNLERRYKEHLRHSTQLIDKKIKEYGIDNFDFEILFVGTYDECKIKEQEYIEQYETMVYQNGYNVTKGGDGVVGFSHSEESKKKMSDSHKNIPHKPHSEETKQKISESNVGKHSNYKPTEETKQKISDSLTGRKLNEEQRKAISNGKIGDKNPMYGKHFNGNQRNAVIESNKRRTGVATMTKKYIGINDDGFIVLSSTIEMKEKGFDRNGIYKCIRGERKTYKGYRWLVMEKEEFENSIYLTKES